MNIKKYYNYLGKKYLDGFKSLGMNLISKKEIDFVLSFLPSSRCKINVLELGTGPGRISKEVIKKNVNFVGIDISWKMISICKERLKKFKNVKLIQYNISKNLPFKDETFDFVYSIRVLKYVNNFEYVISEVSRILKKDGIFVFSMPNKYSINSLNIFHKIQYKRVYKNELLRILVKNGFYIVQIEGGAKLPDFLYNTSNKLFLKIILLIEQFLKRLFGLVFSRTFYISARKKKNINQYFDK